MDALVAPKDYIALFYHAIEVLPCSLPQPLMGGGKLFAKIAVWNSEYTRLRDNHMESNLSFTTNRHLKAAY
jgi:hypothetical protein